MQLRTIMAAILTPALLAACGDTGGGAKATGGADGTRNFSATGFTGVELAGSDDVAVKQAAAFTVTATGPQAVLDQLDIAVKGNVLVISRKDTSFSWGDNDGAKVTITMPMLNRAEVSGSGEMAIDRAASDRVDAVVSGSGKLEFASVEAKAIDIALAGSGDVIVKGGKADSGSISLAGSGDIDTRGMTLANADVSVAGSGDVTLNATGAAKVQIAGSGDVRVGGGAKCDSSELGSGKVSCP